ncbi:hypothetical protein GUJ93_ZPchr0009g1832 [Zizania palustris]|uniref:Uncharacterized protein n=1 Tax=Zizania palustris TaxID=103762 RepID=A0A8J5VKE2_ZIZPA|nr:hypothetical protein GUJ93_ZPchr0009g1832 [Zizania palustris]
MGFMSLLLVACMPIVQVLLIGVIGAFLASGYSQVLTPSALRDMNKVVFTVFTPSLMFASLAKTVTLSDVISWWFMPVNIAITFMAGGTLGWIACKILKPPQHFRGMIIAFCSAGNLGNLLLIVVPAVCDEDGNPFGQDRSSCRSRGLSYSSLSMALGGLFIWTHTYSLMHNAGKMYHKMADSDGERPAQGKAAAYADDEEAPLPVSAKLAADRAQENQMEAPLVSCQSEMVANKKGFWENLKETVHQVAKELMAPPTVSAMLGFVVGLVPWLKSLVVGDGAPLRVIQESLQLMGNGTIPCITLILGGNLTQAAGEIDHACMPCRATEVGAEAYGGDGDRVHTLRGAPAGGHGGGSRCVRRRVLASRPALPLRAHDAVRPASCHEHRNTGSAV